MWRLSALVVNGARLLNRTRPFARDCGGNDDNDLNRARKKRLKRLLVHREIDSHRLTHQGSAFFNIALFNDNACQQPPSVFPAYHQEHAYGHCHRRAHRNTHVLHFGYSDVKSLNKSTKRLASTARRALVVSNNTFARYKNHDAVTEKLGKGELEFCRRCGCECQ